MRTDAHESVALPMIERSTWATRVLRRMSRYLNGDDIFISYSRADGVIYAQSLAQELTRRGFTCRIDLYDTDTSAEIPARLKNVVRASYLLLVIGSPGAWPSRYVKQEIDEFAATGRNFVVVGFGPGIAAACWHDAVVGRIVQERPRTLYTGRPSRGIVSLAEQSFHFQKRNRRLRRVALMTAGAIGAMLLIGLVGGAVLQRDVATKQRALATTQASLTRTESSLGRAQQDLSGAQATLETAQGQLTRTEELRVRATAEANTQEMIARARKEAADAIGIRNRLGYMPVRDAITALKAARSLTTHGLPGEADAALRAVRTTLSALLASPANAAASPEPVENVIHTPGAALLAGQTKAADTVVWRRGASSVLHRFRCGEPAGFVHLALSRDGRYLAQDCAGRFGVFDLEKGERRNGFNVGWTSQIVFGPNHLFVVAQGEVESLVVFDLSSGNTVPIGLKDRAPMRLVLSPDGRFLATSCRWLDGEPPVNCAGRVFELPSLTQTIVLRESDESRQVFSNDGRYLAVHVAGVVRVWETATQLLLTTFPLRSDARLSFGENPGRLYVASGEDARVLDTISGEVLAVFPGGRRVSDDPRVAGAVSVAGRGFTETWRVQPLDRTGFREVLGRASRVLFDVTGRYFSVCTYEGQEPTWRVSLWDIDASEPLMDALAADCVMTFRPDGRAFAFQSQSEGVEVLSLPGMARSRITWRGTLSSLRFDGSRGLIGTNFGDARSFVIETAQVLSDSSETAAAVPAQRAASPYVVDSTSRSLRLQDRVTRKTILETDFRLLGSASSPDGTLVLGANEQELRIWHVPSARVMLARPAPPAASSFAFTPDNRYLAVSWGDRRTRIGLYSWRLEDMLAETCGVLRGSLQSRYEAMRPDPEGLTEACQN